MQIVRIQGVCMIIRRSDGGGCGGGCGGGGGGGGGGGAAAAAAVVAGAEAVSCWVRVQCRSSNATAEGMGNKIIVFAHACYC